MSFRIIVLLLLCTFFCANNAFSATESLHRSTDYISKLDTVKSDLDRDGIADMVGDTVEVSGIANIATGRLHERFMQIFIQNDSSGLSLFAENYTTPVEAGDSLKAVGIVQEYFGLVELKVLSYEVLPGSKKKIREVSLNKAIEDLPKYEGMLVGGEAVVIGKGDRYNGKYLNVSPRDGSDKSILIYVTNFHANYQDFDFESISIGDDVNVAGILTLYNPNTPREDKNVYKIHLRTPHDLSIVGLSKSQMIFWGSIGLAAVILILGWVVSLQSTVKSKTEDLEQSLKEKDILLKEIHHRVKNNLAIMSGLFELQLDTAEHEATKKTLRDSQSRLKSMALVHDKLYKTKNLAEIEMQNYINEMGQSLHDTLESPGQNIEMSYDIDDVKLNIDQAIPCGLLINELVVNAFKHAFNGREQGQIHIRLKEKTGNIELYISDDGRGIPDDFDINQSTSLGMMLIETFRQELGASIEMSNNNGTSFTFTFPAG